MTSSNRRECRVALNIDIVSLDTESRKQLELLERLAAKVAEKFYGITRRGMGGTG
jgi:hypothetical protein